MLDARPAPNLRGDILSIFVQGDPFGMKTSAQILLAKLTEIDGVFKTKRIRASSDTCLENLVAHLRWLKLRHCRKAYKAEHLVSVIFRKPKKFNADAEIAGYCRAHLTVAISQFEQLISEIKTGFTKVSAKRLRNFSPLIHDYLHDLRPIVEYLEKQKDQEYEFFRGCKSYQPMGWQLFRASRQLAIMTINDAVRIDHNVSHIAAVFMLRQALEVKFERIIGVSIFDKTHQSPKVRHGFHYDFIKNNLSYFKFASVNFILLKQIYDWCSFILHRAIQPFAWQLQYAFEISQGLFDSGTIPETGVWSIHGGVRILEKSSMQGAFAEYFHKEYGHGIWCIQYGDTEATSDID